MEKKKKWIGESPKTCGICGTKLKRVFVDALVRAPHWPRGIWAFTCELCHTQYGFGLGTGLGQKYEKKGRNWILTQGGPKCSA